MTSGGSTVYTVGHGARSLEELAAVLADAGVKLLVDVRRYPGSRRHPHFAREALEASLPQLDIAYEWRGEGLGGRRDGARGQSRHPAWRVAAFRAYADYMDTDAFGAALGDLEARVRSGPATAIMCAETLWWRCHRRLIADALTVDGFEIVHLMDRATRQRHSVHESLRVDERNRPVYDLGFTEQIKW